jgi:hypothetical protein
MSKYGFGGGIELPIPKPSASPRLKIEPVHMDEAVQAGAELGFVNREPLTRLKPGPRRKEPQDKVSIPGPKRVIDDFRFFCQEHNMTLWQGLEYLLNAKQGKLD